MLLTIAAWKELLNLLQMMELFESGELYTAQKMKYPIKDFLSKCDQILRKLENLVTFTEEIRNGKLHFLCNDEPVESENVFHMIFDKCRNIRKFRITICE